MKRTFKKSLSLVLALLMVMTVIPFVGVSATCETHNYTYDVAPMKGWHSYQCSNCNSAGYEACSGGAATCKSGAICEKCGAEYTDKSETHGEKVLLPFPQYVSIPANCKYPAFYHYACDICDAPIKDGTGKSYGPIDPNNHQYTSVTSNNNGTHNAECEFCDATLTNVACSDAEPEVTDATCTGKGNTKYTCDVCSYEWNAEISAKGHVYTKESGVKRSDATCTEYITYWYMCNVCGANAKDDPAAQDKYYNGTAKLPHVYNQSKAEAIYIVTPATCQQKATYYKSCVCGASSKDTAEVATFEGAMGTHTWGEYSYNNDAECGKDGTKTATCVIPGCGEKNTVTAEGTALAHIYTREIESPDRLAQAGTCLQRNIYYLTCENCDVFSDGDKFIGKSYGAHNFAGEEITQANYNIYLKTAATCTQRALFYRYCTVCAISSKGLPEETTFEFGTLKAHDYQPIIEDAYIRRQATCVEGAIYTVSCKDCKVAKIPEGIDIFNPTIVIDPNDIFAGLPLDHDMKKIADERAPTCVLAGRTEEWECQRVFAGQKCGHKTGGAEIAKLDHKFVITQEFRAPTCKKNGQYGQKKCEMCHTTVMIDAEGKDVLIPSLNMTATGHIDSDGDMICEKCDSLLEAVDFCKCICHNNQGIMFFIAKLIKWFWKFTNTNQMCECGEYHYTTE